MSVKMRGAAIALTVAVTALCFPAAAAAQVLEGFLVPAAAGAFDTFGTSVSLSGTRMVGGAPSQNGAVPSSGAVTVYELVLGTWTETATLFEAAGSGADNFGRAVSLSGRVALIGAPLHDQAANNAGAAFVFARNNGGWSQLAMLTSSDAAPFDQFGSAVAYENRTAVAGAKFDDDLGSNTGAAYVFSPNAAGVWTQDVKLLGSDTGGGDQLGFSMAMSGGILAVGAPEHDLPVTAAGAVYLFARDALGSWNELQKLTASDAAAFDRFGFSVDVADDIVVVGAPGKDRGSMLGIGAAYVFRRNAAGVWVEEARLSQIGAAQSDELGWSITTDGRKRIVAGARNDQSGAPNGGSAIVYDYTPTGISPWTQSAEIIPFNIAASDVFGGAMSMDAGRVVIGAPFHDSGGMAANGAAYVYRF